MLQYFQSLKPVQLTMLSLMTACPTLLYAESPNSNEQQLHLEIQDLRSRLEKLQAQVDASAVSSSSMTVQPSGTAKGTEPKQASEKLVGSNVSVGSAISDTQLHLYGFVRADASYQFKGGNGIFNHINKADLQGTTTHQDQFYTTVTTSRIGLDLKTKIADQEVGGKLEFDFRGGTDASTARVRHAYITYQNWLIGQTTSNFLANEFIPEIVDFGSPVGVGTFRTPMLRYSDRFSPTTQYSVALEQGRSDNRFPTLTGKLQYKFSQNKGSIALRGLTQEIRVNNSEQKTALSWGIALGAGYQVTNRLTVKGDYNHIKGDDSFMLYSNTAFNTVTTISNPNLNEFDALSLGLTYQFMPTLRGTFGYGAMLANTNNAYAQKARSSHDTTQNKQLQQGWINLMYSPVAPLTFGIEYIYGERQTFDGVVGKDSRIETMVRYSF